MGWKVHGSIFGNIRKSFYRENMGNFLKILELEDSVWDEKWRVPFLEVQQSLPLKKYKVFLNIWARKNHFLKFKEFFFFGRGGGGGLFYFGVLGLICCRLPHFQLLPCSEAFILLVSFISCQISCTRNSK